MGVAQALIEELDVVVVVGPTYIGGSPVSVLLEAEQEADSVIVKEAVTATVSAEAVVVPMSSVSGSHFPRRLATLTCREVLACSRFSSRGSCCLRSGADRESCSRHIATVLGKTGEYGSQREIRFSG